MRRRKRRPQAAIAVPESRGPRRALMTAAVLLGAVLAAFALMPRGNDGETDGRSVPGDPAGPGGGIFILPQAPTAGDDLQAYLSAPAERSAYQWFINGSEVPGASMPVLARGSAVKGDRVSVVMTGSGGRFEASATIANSAPVVRTIAFKPDYPHRGVDIAAVPDGADADGDQLRYAYRWSINDEAAESAGPVLPRGSFRKGDRIVVEITPFDDEVEGAALRSDTLVVENAPPRFTSLPPTALVSDEHRYQAVATDPDEEGLTYSLGSAPDGMTIDPESGAVFWKIPPGYEASAAIQVIATDASGLSARQEYTITITRQRGAQ